MHLSEALELLTRSQMVLADSNILLVGHVGAYREVGTTRRTRSFNQADYRFLTKSVFEERRLLVTPHVLTEVDDLIESDLTGEALSSYRQALVRHIVGKVPNMLEVQIPAAQIAEHPAFLRVGLADASVVLAATSQRCVVVTADFRLADELRRVDRDVINYRNIQPQIWEL